jgi:hypothetical protein
VHSREYRTDLQGIKPSELGIEEEWYRNVARQRGGQSVVRVEIWKLDARSEGDGLVSAVLDDADGGCLLVGELSPLGSQRIVIAGH